jgi:hypothetical protein
METVCFCVSLIPNNSHRQQHAKKVHKQHKKVNEHHQQECMCVNSAKKAFSALKMQIGKAPPKGISITEHQKSTNSR